MKKDEEHNKDIAQKLSYRLEHTKLGDVVSSVQICFDPDDMNTLVEEDKSLMEQYRQFDMMIASCMEEEETTTDKSKWIVRIELDRSAMHDKNLTMDDIHYAVKKSIWIYPLLSPLLPYKIKSCQIGDIAPLGFCLPLGISSGSKHI